MGAKKAGLVLTIGIAAIGLIILVYSYSNRGIETKPTDIDRNDSQIIQRQADEKAAETPTAEKTVDPDAQTAVKPKEKTNPPDAAAAGTLLQAAREALVDSDADTSTRVRIVRQLRHEKSQAAIEILSSYLALDGNVTVVESALQSLAFIGKDSPWEDEIYEIFLEKARDAHFIARGRALVIAAIFNKDDPRTLAVVSDFISEEDEGETGRRYASMALAAVASPDCVAYLKKILDDTKDRDIQKNTLNTLSKIEGDEADEILQEKLYAEGTQAQLDTAWALSQDNHPRGHQMLSEALKNRILSKEALAVIARNPAGPALLEEALAANDFTKEEKIALLEIYNQNMQWATNAVRSGVLEAAKPLINSEDPDLQIQAIRAMGVGFGNIEETVDILMPKLQSTDTQIRKEALGAYRIYMTPDNYKPVLDMIWDEDEKIRRYALICAAEFIDESDQPLLEKALNHEDEFIRERVSQMVN
jgi:hypothetical protein